MLGKEPLQRFPGHAAQREVASAFPVLGVQAEEGQQINGRFKDEKLAALALVAEAVGFIRTGHVQPEPVRRSPAVGIPGQAGLVPADEHGVMMTGFLIKIAAGNEVLHDCRGDAPLLRQIVQHLCVAQIPQR